MPLREQRRHRQPHHLRLAEHDRRDVAGQPGGDLGERLDLAGRQQFGPVHRRCSSYVSGQQLGSGPVSFLP
jgi:hypothetical protein